MMNQEVAQNPQPSWFSQTKSFFSLPNPKIFQVFVSSGAATFVWGAAMIVDWILYSRFHKGSHWIIFYASFLMAFPVIIWTVMALSVVFFNKHQNLDILPLSDSTELEKVQIDHHQEQDQTVQDRQLAIMKVDQVVDDDGHSSNVTKELPSSILVIDDNKMLKRMSSWPFLGTAVSSCGKNNRRASF